MRTEKVQVEEEEEETSKYKHNQMRKWHRRKHCDELKMLADLNIQTVDQIN